MHSSIIITSLCAALAVAKPLHRHAKKEYKTELKIETVFVTVTAGAPVLETEVAAPSTVVVFNTVYAAGGRHSKQPKPSPVASAAPVKSEAPVVVVTSIEAPVVIAQAPSSSPAPVVVQPTSIYVAPVVVPTTSVAPVVVQPSPTAVAASSAVVDALSGYPSMAVAQHNVHRANHSAPDVAWNQTLADWALNTAKSCVFKHDMTQGTGNYGQNIQDFGRSPWNNLDLTTAGANGITEYWYNGEVNLFPESAYDNTKSDPDMGADWLHFSALVWKSTKTIGCATYKCAAGTLDAKVETAYTVCNYFPAGNMGGSYGANIGKPLGKATFNALLN